MKFTITAPEGQTQVEGHRLRKFDNGRVGLWYRRDERGIYIITHEASGCGVSKGRSLAEAKRELLAICSHFGGWDGLRAEIASRAAKLQSEAVKSV